MATLISSHEAWLHVLYVDTQVFTSLFNAYNAGMKVRDVYLFPCPTCSKSAATQVSELVSYLNANYKIQWSGRIWLDIEGTQYWLSSTSANQAWYKQLKDLSGEMWSVFFHLSVVLHLRVHFFRLRKRIAALVCPLQQCRLPSIWRRQNLRDHN